MYVYQRKIETLKHMIVQCIKKS